VPKRVAAPGRARGDRAPSRVSVDGRARRARAAQLEERKSRPITGAETLYTVVPSPERGGGHGNGDRVTVRPIEGPRSGAALGPGGDAPR